MWDLERVASGMFTKASTITLDALTKENFEKHLLPMDEALHMYEKKYFDDSAEKLLINGVTIKDDSLTKNIEKNIIYRVYLKNNTFIGLGKKDECGFKIIKLLLI